MEITPNKTRVRFSSLMCALGHDYMITKTITPYLKEYKCCKCGREVTDGIDGQLKQLTEKERIVNECVSAFVRKKHNYVKPAV